MEENKVIEIEVKKENVFKRTHKKISNWWNESGKEKAKTVGKIAIGMIAAAAGVIAASAVAKAIKESDEENDENLIETEDYTVVDATDDSPIEE